VLEPGLPPIGVLLHTRRVHNTQLLGQVIDQLGWHIQRIGQKHPQMPHRHHLQRETQTAVIPAPQRNQPPILIIQMEEPLQLHPRQQPEPAIAVDTLADHRDMIADQHKQPARGPLPPLSSQMFLPGREPAQDCLGADDLRRLVQDLTSRGTTTTRK
jgi:hypothetical protein